jgi:endonuclease/exonuclease/phosphatase (EEP) superfamily protein YafD
MTQNAGNTLAPPDRLAALLRDSGADVIGLQEVTRLHAAALEGLADIYPYRTHQGDGIPGKGILSKFPIGAIEPLELYPKRADMKATVEIGGRDLLLLVAHPPPPTLHSRGYSMNNIAREQIHTLVEMATTGGQPAILLGDFNLTPGTALYRHASEAGLIDAFRESGRGPGGTLPVHYARVPTRPVLRVDYIWHTPHLRSLDAWVGEKCGSDHLPVLVRFAWANGHD